MAGSNAAEVREGEYREGNGGGGAIGMDVWRGATRRTLRGGWMAGGNSVRDPERAGVM